MLSFMLTNLSLETPQQILLNQVKSGRKTVYKMGVPACLLLPRQRKSMDGLRIIEVCPLMRRKQSAFLEGSRCKTATFGCAGRTY